VWEYRDLLWMLGVRDVKLRYRQTALGVIWVILQPLLAAAIFTVVFGIIAGVPTGGLPQFLVSYVGMLAWNVFAQTLSKVSTCLVGSAHLVSKIYFPRLILPFSTLFSTLLDFAVALALVPVLLLAFQITPHAGILLLPVFLLIVLMLAMGVGLFLAALTVSYRDVQYVLPVVVQLLMWASPVHYVAAEAAKRLPRAATPFLTANPLTGPLEGFRWALLGQGHMNWPLLGVSALVGMVTLAVGLMAFKNLERRFADVI